MESVSSVWRILRDRKGVPVVIAWSVRGSLQTSIKSWGNGKSEGKALSEWSREVLLQEARSPRLNALFTEIVATRMLLNLILKPIAFWEKMTTEEFSNVLTKVHTTKHTGAKDVMKQYTVPQQKE